MRPSNSFPPPQGLYSSRYEHDRVGFVANIEGHKDHTIIENGQPVNTGWA